MALAWLALAVVMLVAGLGFLAFALWEVVDPPGLVWEFRWAQQRRRGVLRRAALLHASNAWDCGCRRCLALAKAPR